MTDYGKQSNPLLFIKKNDDFISFSHQPLLRYDDLLISFKDQCQNHE